MWYLLSNVVIASRLKFSHNFAAQDTSEGALRKPLIDFLKAVLGNLFLFWRMVVNAWPILCACKTAYQVSNIAQRASSDYEFNYLSRNSWSGILCSTLPNMQPRVGAAAQWKERKLKTGAMTHPCLLLVCSLWLDQHVHRSSPVAACIAPHLGHMSPIRAQHLLKHWPPICLEACLTVSTFQGLDIRCSKEHTTQYPRSQEIYGHWILMRLHVFGSRNFQDLPTCTASACPVRPLQTASYVGLESWPAV